jgi:hypothetical protein
MQKLAAPTSRITSNSWLQLIAIISLIVVIPALVSPRVPVAVSRQSITTEKPDEVFIGNSMLETRIDIEQYKQLNNGKTAIALIDPGVSSAGWYLRLKNQVLDSNTQPEKVFIFFRSDEITNPLKHTSGRAASVLNDLKIESEPIFDSLVGQNLSLDQSLSIKMRTIYSIQERRPSALAALERTAASLVYPKVIIHTVRRALSIIGLGQFNRAQYRATLDDFNNLKQETNTIFSRPNYRSINEQDAETDSVGDFSELVGASFLPAMIELVSNTETQLIFVKVQNRPNPDGTLRSRVGISKYVDDLQVYLQSHGAGFIDMTGTPEISLDKYLDGDHIIPSFMTEYTELFSLETAELRK